MINMLNPPTERILPAKTRTLILGSLFLGVLALPLLAPPRASAQTPPGLNLQLYAGLSITGAVGTVYSVEYVTDFAQTNAWRCLTFLQLPATNYLWFDPTAPATGQRFYRATQFKPPLNMAFIPPGTFRMGSPTNEPDRSLDEGPQTAVTISHGVLDGEIRGDPGGISNGIGEQS